MQEWHLCQKTDYTVELCRADADRVYNTPRKWEVYNYLEDITETVHPDTCVCRGTVGELYLVPFAKLAAYDVRPEEIGEDWLTVRTKPSGLVYCCHRIDGACDSPTPYGVMHANRAGVPHGDGDMLLCAAEQRERRYVPLDDNVWVVNGAVFAMTYRLLETVR